MWAILPYFIKLQAQVTGSTMLVISKFWNVIVAVQNETECSSCPISFTDSSQKQVFSPALRTEQAYMMPPCIFSKPLTICWQELPELDVAPMNLETLNAFLFH